MEQHKVLYCDERLNVGISLNVDTNMLICWDSKFKEEKFMAFDGQDLRWNLKRNPTLSNYHIRTIVIKSLSMIPANHVFFSNL